VTVEETNRREDPRRLRVGDDEMLIHVDGEASGGAALAIEVEIPAGGGPPALHRHDSFELYRVERGRLAFYLAADSGEVRRSEAGEGEVVAIPSGREHTIRNESAKQARAFVVFTPGGEMERFALAASEVGEEAGDPASVALVAAESGIEITRPLEGLR
jgi:mannose-6-phosphate isomerase-like protein (cupin superfamily)